MGAVTWACNARRLMGGWKRNTIQEIFGRKNAVKTSNVNKHVAPSGIEITRTLFRTKINLNSSNNRSHK